MTTARTWIYKVKVRVPDYKCFYEAEEAVKRYELIDVSPCNDNGEDRKAAKCRVRNRGHRRSEQPRKSSANGKAEQAGSDVMHSVLHD